MRESRTYGSGRGACHEMHVPTATAPRVHHAARRRGGCVAAGGKGLPLPDAEGSMKEIAYALDTLKLDGIGLMTSYAGKPLGDPSFAAVFDEINRRKLAVYVHPTMSCCGMGDPQYQSAGDQLLPTDTTRAIASLTLSETSATASTSSSSSRTAAARCRLSRSGSPGRLRNFRSPKK